MEPSEILYTRTSYSSLGVLKTRFLDPNLYLGIKYSWNIPVDHATTQYLFTQGESIENRIFLFLFLEIEYF